MTRHISGRSTVVGPGGAAPSWSQGYVAGLLWRRGLRHRDRLAEGLDVARQWFELELCRCGGSPPDGKSWRTLLDQAVYRALRELQPLGDGAAKLDQLAARATESDESVRWRASVLSETLERLAVRDRLIVKLKLADLYYPDLQAGRMSWQADEVGFLETRHLGRSVREIESELRSRLLSETHRHPGKVPSRVIAWLLSIASPAAVDTAYRSIKQKLTRAVPQGAADQHLTAENLIRSLFRHFLPLLLRTISSIRRSSPYGRFDESVLA